MTDELPKPNEVADVFSAKDILRRLVNEDIGGMSLEKRNKLDLYKVGEEVERLRVCTTIPEVEAAFSDLTGEELTNLDKFKIRFGLLGCSAIYQFKNDSGRKTPVVAVLNGKSESLRHELSHAANWLTGTEAAHLANRWAALEVGGLSVITLTSVAGGAVLEGMGKTPEAGLAGAVGLVSIGLASLILKDYWFNPEEIKARKMAK